MATSAKPDRPVRQNPSGHICMNTAESSFFAECNNRANRIANQQAAGILKPKRGRNPLNAESSPRVPAGYIFDFSVPEKSPEPQKWIYPENDWGLMAKLRSQKAIYDDIRQREENYAQTMKEVKIMKAQNELKYKEALAREIEKKTEVPGETTKSAREAVVEPRIHRNKSEVQATLNPEDEDLLKDIRRQSAKLQSRQLQQLPGYTRPPKKVVAPKPVEFFDQKVSTLKPLQSSHPDLLEKWRADRAAEFVSKGGQRAIDPPPHRVVSNATWMPGGQHRVEKPALGGSKKGSGRSREAAPADPHQPTQSMDAMYDTLDTLQNQLRQTSYEVDRQKLKIALKSSKKGYER